MNVNTYAIIPMDENEKSFLLSNQVSPALIDLYIRIREKILAYGKIQISCTRGYISFKHPYGRGDIKLGTLTNVYFKNDHIVLAFNMRNTTPNDPKNKLIKAKGYGICNYYAKIWPNDDLSGLDCLIQQGIYCVSNTHRIVRIDNKFVTI